MLVVLMLLATMAFSQDKYMLEKSESNMSVSGTSTVHDWEMDVKNFDGIVSLETEDGEKSIKSVYFVAKANSLKSDKRIMNDKTYDALKAEDHPKITFRFAEVKSLKTEGNNFSGVVSGYLSIAGKTRKVSIAFSGNQYNDKIVVTGSKTIDMPDYEMDPPTAMLGSIKTGEKVKVSFNLTFNKS